MVLTTPLPALSFPSTEAYSSGDPLKYGVVNVGVQGFYRVFPRVLATGQAAPPTGAPVRVMGVLSPMPAKAKTASRSRCIARSSATGTRPANASTSPP